MTDELKLLQMEAAFAHRLGKQDEAISTLHCSVDSKLKQQDEKIAELEARSHALESRLMAISQMLENRSQH